MHLNVRPVPINIENNAIWIKLNGPKYGQSKPQIGIEPKAKPIHCPQCPSHRTPGPPPLSGMKSTPAVSSAFRIAPCA
jgi:hypothetical protein